MFKIRRDDIVKVLTGKDIGKTGKVLKIFPSNNRAIVEGVNIIKKHLRRRRQEQQSGIVKIESPINISNLILICSHCNKQTKAGSTFLKDGEKVRGRQIITGVTND